jgi:formiminotetrahydrofolate cyclodeaminase
MASSRSYLELTVSELLDELAGTRAAPGGGSALGVAVATGAAVLAMAARVSQAPGLGAQADALRERTAPLAQLDADSYDEALAARDGAEALRPEQRDWEIGRAFARAAEPPLEIARAGADVAELAAELAARGDPRVRADALAAAWLGAGAARGAVALVALNLTAVADDPRVSEVEQLAAAAEASARRAAH